MPFTEDDNDDVKFKPKKPNIGTGSSLDKQIKPPTNEQFQKTVKKVEEQKSEYAKIASDITQKFFDLLKDKTLVENQSPIQKNFRKEVLEDMLNFAINLNNDDMEEQNDMGSVALISILLKSNLALKDFANKLEYDIKQLQTKIALIEKTKDDKQG